MKDKLPALKTLISIESDVKPEVLEAAKGFVDVVFAKGHDDAEAFAKAEAERMGIKLGDFMMPVRLAVTGSRISPPLIGSIQILGKEKSLARIERTLATF